MSFTLNNIHVDYEQDNKLHVKHWSAKQERTKPKKKNQQQKTKKTKQKQKNTKNNQTDIKRKDCGPEKFYGDSELHVHRQVGPWSLYHYFN